MKDTRSLIVEAGKVVELSPLVEELQQVTEVFLLDGNKYLFSGQEEAGKSLIRLTMNTLISTAAAPNIKQILVTHAHPDHSPGVRLLKENLDIPAYGMLTVFA